ncbi:10015_t:CDS:2, partial [Entrophospora sp. SA101]
MIKINFILKRINHLDIVSGFQERNKKYIELSTQRNGVYFTTTEMKDLNEKYEELDLQYAEEQSSLEKEVLLVAATYCSVLEKMNELIAHIDVIVSFSSVSINAPMPVDLWVDKYYKDKNKKIKPTPEFRSNIRIVFA